MTAYKVVVDGSNIATEGRSKPSLAQLDEAVRAFIDEHEGADVLVVVDSSFPNRIDPKEVRDFEAAYNAGEIITPPAGTIGRGDSFILKVADKLGATIFSNDSFQEFHGTYDWLFSKGRLVGGKPIPGLGWVFIPRTPVRGPKSRDAVREAKRTQVRIGSPEAMRPMPVPKAPPPFAGKKSDDETGFDRAADGAGGSGGSGDGRRGGRKKRRRGRGRGESDAAVSTGPNSGGSGSNSGGSSPAGAALNEPIGFLTFIAGNPIGATVDGQVVSYSSHGFYVLADGANCYVQLAGVSTPPPRSAKEIVRKGESREFVVVGFDRERRGVELALASTPAAEAVPAAIASGNVEGAVVADGAGSGSGSNSRSDSGDGKRRRKRRGGSKRHEGGASTSVPSLPEAATVSLAEAPKAKAATRRRGAAGSDRDGSAAVSVEGAAETSPKTSASTKTSTRKQASKTPSAAASPAAAVEAAPVKTRAKKAAAKPAATATADQPAPAKAPTAKKAVAKKAVAKKAVVEKVIPAPAKAVVKKSVAKKASAENVAPAAAKSAAAPKKAEAKKAVAKKSAATTSAAAPAKAAPAKAAAKAVVAKKTAPAKAAAEKAAPAKATAKKAAPAKATAKKAVPAKAASRSRSASAT